MKIEVGDKFLAYGDPVTVTEIVKGSVPTIDEIRWKEDNGAKGWDFRSTVESGDDYVPLATEIRVTDPKTGGQKGRKQEEYALIPVAPLAKMADLYSEGTIDGEDGVSVFYELVEAFRGRSAPNEALICAAIIALEEMTSTERTEMPAVQGRAYSRIPVDALAEVARVYWFGAYGKPVPYAPWNWLKGYDWSLSFSALGRHAAKVRSGVLVDEESGLSHWAHIVFHLFSLYEFSRLGLGTDDRQP